MLSATLPKLNSGPLRPRAVVDECSRVWTEGYPASFVLGHGDSCLLDTTSAVHRVTLRTLLHAERHEAVEFDPRTDSFLAFCTSRVKLTLASIVRCIGLSWSTQRVFSALLHPPKPLRNLPRTRPEVDAGHSLCSHPTRDSSLSLLGFHTERHEAAEFDSASWLFLLSCTSRVKFTLASMVRPFPF